MTELGMFPTFNVIEVASQVKVKRVFSAWSRVHTYIPKSMRRPEAGCLQKEKPERVSDNEDQPFL